MPVEPDDVLPVTEIVNDSRTTLKMIFAEDEFEAEQRLGATRDAPILREWEK